MADQEDLAAARVALGAQLAALRGARGYTQRALTRRLTGYSRSTVANVETGRQHVSRDFWAQCDLVLDTNGRLTAGHDELEATRQARRRQAAQEAEEIRKQTIGLPATPTTTDVFPLPKARAPAAGDVDPALVPHWWAMLTALAASHNVFGPRRLHDIVRGELVLIRAHRRAATGDLAAQLLGVEARWAEFASWTADNLGDRQCARWWLDRSLELARRAGLGPVIAYALMRRAQQAADRRDGGSAVELASGAGRVRELSERDRALCALRRAQGHALIGDPSSCRKALAEAHELVDRADALAEDEDPETIGTHCTRFYLTAHDGYCRLHLGRPRDAIGVFEDVLVDWPLPYRQDEGLTRAWLALAYSAAGDATAAGDEGVRALSLAVDTASARTLRALAVLDRRFGQAHRGAPEAEQFRARFAMAAGGRCR